MGWEEKLFVDWQYIPATDLTTMVKATELESNGKVFLVQPHGVVVAVCSLWAC